MGGADDPHRSRAARTADPAAAPQREFGLGEQLEQIGAGAQQPHFDDLRRHRDDLVDRRQERGEGVARAGSDLPPQLRDDLVGGDRAAIGPLGVAEAEDVAGALIDDDPAFGEPRFDLAAGVEPHQPLCRRIEQQPGRRIGQRAAGIGKPRCGADRTGDDRPRIGPPVATADRRGQRQRKSHGADGGTRTRTP